MSYSVKELFYTVQGEGAQSGRPALFCRFSGCNLWSGQERDRSTADCRFCDTDFVGVDGLNGGRYASTSELVEVLRRLWPEPAIQAFVVFTGGEPLLQLDRALLAELHRQDFEVAVETNGTVVALEEIDWICVSPKAGCPLLQQSGDELKLVYPQPGAEPELYQHLAFRYFYLQPMDGERQQANTQSALRYCMDHPQWRLSLQSHKMIGVR